MTPNQNTICLITCWYGPYPWYFPYFIKSCAYNGSIDFIIITENQVAVLNKPENVKFVYKTLNEIQSKASKKLGFEVSLTYPYKLCDLKPAYGYLFSELIEDYSFWGVSDIDIIYGNIRGFISEDMLQHYDIISGRHDYLTGSFCLFRNTEKINRLFMESKDMQQVFSSPQHYCFDECNFLFKELQNGRSIFEFPSNIQSMTYIVKKAENEGRIKAFFDFIIVEGVPGKITWEKGKVFYRDEFEAMFYHLIKFKTICKHQIAFDPIPETLHFTSKSITTTKNW